MIRFFILIFLSMSTLMSPAFGCLDTLQKLIIEQTIDLSEQTKEFSNEAISRIHKKVSSASEFEESFIRSQSFYRPQDGVQLSLGPPVDPIFDDIHTFFKEDASPIIQLVLRILDEAIYRYKIVEKRYPHSLMLFVRSENWDPHFTGYHQHDGITFAFTLKGNSTLIAIEGEGNEQFFSLPVPPKHGIFLQKGDYHAPPKSLYLPLNERPKRVFFGIVLHTR